MANKDSDGEAESYRWAVSASGPPWVVNAAGDSDLLGLLGLRQLSVQIGSVDDQSDQDVWWASCDGQLLTRAAPSFLTAVDAATHWVSESTRQWGRARVRLTCAEKRLDEWYMVGDHGRMVSERDGLVAQAGW